jgi:hypothetical protein
LDGHDGLHAFGGSAKPSQFHNAFAFEPEEPAVMWVPLSLEMRLEKEHGVDFSFHHRFSVFLRSRLAAVK